MEGSSIGNVTLRHKLQWEEKKYWKIRDSLFDKRLIGLGRGKGGSLYRISDVVQTPAVNEQEYPPTKYNAEKDLYEPFVQTIEKNYVADLKIRDYILQNTSTQGRKFTGGSWTRPDVTLITVDTFSFIPGKVMNIITFEIKHNAQFDIYGVFETAAHSRFANKSYYVGYLPNDWKGDNNDYQRIQNECDRFEIGLMYFTNPADYNTYEILLEPERRIPDPADQDEFIRVQIDKDNQDKLRKLF